ncbi:MAG: hypothetical protein JXB32_12815, partial [Deltaproteobacteria bacterium]|nr:hypothetical protein [Deltaproteobacteria bacterium]
MGDRDATRVERSRRSGPAVSAAIVVAAAALLFAPPASAQPTSGWFGEGPRASSATGGPSAPDDPRQVASEALERLQNGQG